jgi:glycosyltransferase involved in cell wall biosynthesis
MAFPDHLTILMPGRDQKDSFLAAAVESVLRQTSPDWRLLVIIDAETPAAVGDLVKSFADERICLVLNQGAGLGGALNTGMRIADSLFVCVLLSDDALDSTAVATALRYIRRYPRVDFFYSSRRLIDAVGAPQGPVLKAARRFTLKDFTTRGSRVKHFLCWRRAKGLEVGGIDERFSAHGCDDCDFAWTMAEAGARFRAIRE